jgi:hypothetical protein
MKKASSVSSTSSIVSTSIANLSEEELSVPRPSFSLESFMRKPVAVAKNSTKPVEPTIVTEKANPWSKIPTTSTSTNNRTNGKPSPSSVSNTITSSAAAAAASTKINHAGINKTIPKSLLEIQAEEERKHQNLFVHGNCVLDKYESAWSVGITRGAAASLRDLMTQQEEALQREEQIRKDALLAKQIKKQEQERINQSQSQSKHAKKNKNSNSNNNNNCNSKNQSTVSTTVKKS